MILIYVPDLMMRAKVLSIVKTFDEEFMVLRDLELPEEWDVLIADLERPGVMGVLREHPEGVVAFCPHVRADLLEEAKEAGCEKVFVRSRFFSELPGLLKEYDSG